MTTLLEPSYQPLQPYGAEIGETEETPHESGIMIHVVPESGKARWNHIEDLDSFFTRMYQYHQKHGFYCMLLQQGLELIQFIFVVVFSTFLLQCVDYPVLFRDKAPEKHDNKTQKISLSDAIIPLGECVSGIPGALWIILLVAFIFWALRAVKVLLHIMQFWEIKSFFNTALKINDSDLDNLTWHEIQRRIRDVQREQQMCIHKQDLSELDIYHRILRFKNYMVAMVNKSLLPVKITLPFLGETIILTQGLKYNLELILFWGPFAPFENNWHLKEDYKKSIKRKELAESLSKYIWWVGIANFVLCPLILLWQILYSFFNYAEMIKREPGTLGSRFWSLYGRLYLRHFNELDHELHARLNRAYRPASKYMNIFTSPLMTIIAKTVGFVAGAMLAVLVILTLYDEDVLTVEHVLMTITVLGAVVAGCRVFIPDENLVWCPEKLMTAVLAHVHYLPDTWRGQAHTNIVRDEFAQLFQYRAIYLLEELLSPIITPFILCFYIRHKALDIVDFYRNFTVEVVGVGDVCSFAQMDVRRHGNATWQTSVHAQGSPSDQANQYTQAEDGKTELSLVHFTLTNPEWRPPTEAENFVIALRQQARRDAGIGATMSSPLSPAANNPLLTSLHSVSSLGTGYSSTMTSVLRGIPLGGHLWRSEMAFDHGLGPLSSDNTRHIPATPTSPASAISPAVRGGLNRAEGPLQGSDKGLLYSLTQCGPSLGNSVFGPGSDLRQSNLSTTVGPSLGDEIPSLEFAAADMSLSTLYLHELHHRQIRRRGTFLETSSRSVWQRPHQDMPGISELPDDERDPLPLQQLSQQLPSASSSPLSSQQQQQRLAERTPLLEGRSPTYTKPS